MQPRATESLSDHPARADRVVLVAFVAAALTGSVAAGVSTVFFPLSSAVIDTALGEQIFGDRCASCHALDPGVERLGPSLHLIGRTARRRVAGMDAEQYILESILHPDAFRAPGAVGEMPEGIASGLTRDELLGLTAFLARQGGTLRPKRLLRLATDAADAPDADRLALDCSSIERGRALFLGTLGCVECHSLDPYPGSDLAAPSLLGIGFRHREAIAESILRPSHRIHPRYETCMVSVDGRIIPGRRLPASPDTIRLLVTDERGGLVVRDFDESALEPLDDQDHVALSSPTSRMPDYGATLNRADLDALLDFLTVLR